GRSGDDVCHYTYPSVRLGWSTGETEPQNRRATYIREQTAHHLSSWSSAKTHQTRFKVGHYPSPCAIRHQTDQWPRTHGIVRFMTRMALSWSLTLTTAAALGCGTSRQ